MPADVSPASALVRTCIEREVTVATAESLTAGMVASTIADVPGCSAVFRGGVVTYATDTKGSLLGIPADLLEHVVSEDVVVAMAERTCVVLDARLGLATTGVAGPDELDGQPAGTVWIAACLDGRTTARHLRIPGERDAVRAGASAAVLALALELLG